jgi:type IV pilus assembly protein PilB
MNASRKRIGELLVEDGTIDETQLRAALGHQRQWGGKLGQTIIDLKLASEARVLRALSRRLQCEVAPPDALEPSPAVEEAVRLLPAELARRRQAVPIEATRTTVTVAMADPGDIAAVDEIAFRTGRRVKPVLASRRALAAAVRRFYSLGLDRDDAIDVDFDVHAESVPDQEPLQLVDTSPARFQERFYQSSLREWSAAAGVKPQLVAPMAPPPPEERSAARPGSLLDALAKMGAGTEVPQLPPEALVAAVTTVLLRRGLVTEAEVLGELWNTRTARVQQA